MAKIRVYELAKQLGVESKALIEVLTAADRPVRNHMSALDAETAEWVRQRFRPEQETGGAPSAPKTAGSGSKPQGTRPQPSISGRQSGAPPSRQAATPRQAGTAPARAGGANAASKSRPPAGGRPSGASRSAPTSKPSERKPLREGAAGRRPAAAARPRQARPAAASSSQPKANGATPVAARPEAARPKRPEPGSRGKLEIPESILVKDLAGRIGVQASAIIKFLMKNGVMVTINQAVPHDVAALVATRLGFEVVKPQDVTEKWLEDPTDPPEKMQPRPPVVTILGHVDHGKTTLLDSIREAKVAAGEAGGITQHIGAYQVDVDGRKITFLDTPGHAAFTAMRARGAQVTDIAVLVVAADDGVMPQTVEAINHAKAAEVPIIVAINKMDRPEANPERVMQELTEHGLVPEAWGGDTVCVQLSALRKEGLDELLEMIQLVADLQELQANPDRLARGLVIEAEVDRGRGPVATVLIQKGTMRTGDSMVAGSASGRVRAMFSHTGESLSEAGPSTPVLILGLSDAPPAGEVAVAVPDERIAREIASARKEEERATSMRGSARTSLEDLFERIKEGEVKELPVIIKADVQGSVEAMRESLEKLSTDEVRVNVIHGAVGGITETDVNLAAASNAIIIGFNVRPDPTVRRVAERENVDIRLYRVIYEAIDDVKKAMSGLLDPEYKEVVLGRAEVRATFRVPHAGIIAGCYVTDGMIQRNAQARVLRDGVVVYEGPLGSLRRFKDDVREVSEGYECGIGLERFNDVKEGDVIEAYRMEEVPRELAHS